MLNHDWLMLNIGCLLDAAADVVADIAVDVNNISPAEKEQRPNLFDAYELAMSICEDIAKLYDMLERDMRDSAPFVEQNTSKSKMFK